MKSILKIKNLKKYYEHIQLIEDIMKLPNDIDVKKEELEKMKIRRAL